MELAVIIPVLAMSDEMIRARIELLREKAPAYNPISYLSEPTGAWSN